MIAVTHESMHGGGISNMADIPYTWQGPENGGNFEYHWSDDYLQAHFISDVGKKRQHNEDACIMCAPEDTTLAKERGLLFAVADGMGGASAGEFASRLSLTTVTQAFYSGEMEGAPEHVRAAIEEANKQVFAEADRHPEYHGMGTTMSAIVIMGDCAYIGQVGDSRVYLSREKSDLLQITEDHSLVAEQLRNGVITAEEAKNHSLKNLITRAVGIKQAVEVDLFGFKLKKGDTVLLCSDGLSNMVDDDDIDASLRNENLQGAARILVGKALENGGTDNISVALIRVTQSPKKGALQPGCDEVTVPVNGIFDKIKRLMT